MLDQKFATKQFLMITLVVSIWINISEVFRYFVFIRPRIKSFFDGRDGIAEMDLGIFTIWGFWDTLLTLALVFIFWLFARTFGNSTITVLLAGTVVWSTVFVIFWVATANMGLSDWKTLLIALPLSLLEMVVGAWLASKLYATNRWAA